MSYNSEQTRIAARETADAVKQLTAVVTELRFQIHLMIATEKARSLLTDGGFHGGIIPRQCPFCSQLIAKTSVGEALDHMVDHIFREYGMPNVTLRPSDRLLLESDLNFAPDPSVKRR